MKYKNAKDIYFVMNKSTEKQLIKLEPDKDYQVQFSSNRCSEGQIGKRVFGPLYRYGLLEGDIAGHPDTWIVHLTEIAVEVQKLIEEDL